LAAAACAARPYLPRPHRAAESAAGDSGRAADDEDQQRVRQAPEELRRFLDDVKTVEPLLRLVASHEVQTTVPLNEVVWTVLRLVDA